MGLAIIEMFETMEEALKNVDRIAKEQGVDKDRLFVLDESGLPGLCEGNKKFSVSLD